MKPNLITVVFSFSLFASSFLLFALEPLITKMVLPLLGGSASVWNTALMFFQTMLLIGYIYAHFLTKITSRYTQIIIHGALLLSAGTFLPPMIDPIVTSEMGLHPILWTLFTFGASIGLPFFMLASTAPLLQHWYSLTCQTDANDPYFLYAASNSGSLLALLAYPTIIEPNFGLLLQADTWSLSYVSVVLMVVISGAFVFSRKHPAGMNDSGKNIRPEAITTQQHQKIPWPTKLRWLLWSFIPSAMLLAVTLHIAVDIAAAPFLWVIPLACYLLTFVIAFMRNPIIRIPLAHQLHAWLVIGVVIYFSAPDFWLILGLHVGVLFFTGLVYHLALAKSRPAADHLTEFYLWISVGGWLGGVFGGLIAPLLFTTLLEYPMLIIAAVLFRPPVTVKKSQAYLFDVLLPLGIGAYFLIPRYIPWLNPGYFGGTGILIYYALLAMALNKFRDHPIRFGLSTAVLLLSMHLVNDDTRVVDRWRSFYGTYEVSNSIGGEVRLLKHGTTIHGAQAIDTNYASLPLTYYNYESPLGQVVTKLRSENRLENITAVGLGIGTIACHFRDNEQLTIFEIDPLVERIARDGSLFTYLSRCNQSEMSVVIEDGRLGIEGLPDHSQDLIIMDAFSSDAIPSHLLTVEAIQTYFDKLDEDGILLVHISNKYIKLAPVIAGVADTLQLTALRYTYRPTARERDRGGYASDWMAVSRQPEYLLSIADDSNWQSVTQGAKHNVWTDDYSNLFRSLIWGKLLWSRDSP